MERPVCVFNRGDVALNVAHYIAASGSNLPPVMVEKCGGPERKPLTFYVLTAPEDQHNDVLGAVTSLCEEHSDLVNSLVRCPECQSIHLEFPNRPHASGTMQGLGWILEKLNEKIIHGSSAFHCENCDYSWKSNEEETMRESGALGSVAESEAG